MAAAEFVDAGGNAAAPALVERIDLHPKAIGELLGSGRYRRAEPHVEHLPCPWIKALPEST
jgi:hypothetical protein